MDRQAIEAKVVAAIAHQFEIAESTVAKDSRIQEDLGADSLDRAELAMDIEDEFDITLRDDDESVVKTVDDLVTAVEKQLKGA